MAPATTPVPAPPITQPNIVVAPPIGNAIVASNANLAVIIPARLNDDDDDDDDDSDAALASLRATIGTQMAAARQHKTKSAPTVAIYLNTTDDYGCDCPPFVLAPFYNAGEGGFIWPKFASGVAAAPAPKGGLLRFAGHFEACALTGYQAAGRRVPKLKGAAKDSDDAAEPDPLLERHPAFFVTAWCFEPSPTITQSTFENYGTQLTELAKQGRFCVGTKFPIVTP